LAVVWSILAPLCTSGRGRGTHWLRFADAAADRFAAAIAVTAARHRSLVTPDILALLAFLAVAAAACGAIAAGWGNGGQPVAGAVAYVCVAGGAVAVLTIIVIILAIVLP
jgi:hypothetical protein